MPLLAFSKRLAVDLPLMEVNTLLFMVAQQYGADDVKMAEHPAFKQLRAVVAPKPEMAKGGIAILPIQGTLAYNPDPWEMLYDGVEDSRAVLKMINDAADDDGVAGALLRMDTPGGMVLGGPEMADAVTRMKAKKPVVAHIGGMGASLGYMIASQAGTIVANRSAIVGSIGVIASVTDYSALLEKIGIKLEYFTNKEAKFKGAGAVGNKLTEDHRTQIQASIDSAFQMFKGMVLSARPNVPESAMQGQTFRGTEAKSIGLVDHCGDEQCALGILMSQIRNK